MLLKEMMDVNVVTLSLKSNLEEAIKIFSLSKLDGLPVVDDQNYLVGFFTRSNLYNAILGGHALNSPITLYMINDPFKVNEDATYETVELVVIKSIVGAAPVVNQFGQVVGMLTKSSMVMATIKQLGLTNAQLQAVMDAIPSGVIAVETNGAVSLINKSAENILDLSVERVMGHKYDNLGPLPGLEDVLKDDERLIGQKMIINSVVVVADVVPIKQVHTVVGALIVFQVLTDLEQLVRELKIVKDYNETLRTVLNIINDGIVVVDEQGIINVTNTPFSHFVNTPVEDLIGKHITDVIPNSRLHLVARTGVSELSDIQTINNQQLIVSRLPILRDGRPEGAVGKIVFPNLLEVQELVRIVNSLQNKVQYYEEELVRTNISKNEVDSILGQSASITAVKETLLRVAHTSSTILITGESGTGKELVAKAIHYCSLRKDGPFIKVNCAAIPENLLESEMFGYAPGAFSGADKRGKPGRFELADGGTIFFDEIGEMSSRLQAKLLRVLQEREFERVGGTKTIRVNVRILSATNRDLLKAIAEGNFREDLYYRLNVININLPPLRDRSEDIQLLATEIIKRLNKILKTNILGLTPEALSCLQNYYWPGNVRELENVLEHAANFALEGWLHNSHFPPYIVENSSNNRMSANLLSNSTCDSMLYKQRLFETEKEVILEALKEAGGNKSLAAQILNMSRSKLYARLRKLGI